eukprot:4571115-Amphidinium_carterae.1
MSVVYTKSFTPQPNNTPKDVDHHHHHSRRSVADSRFRGLILFWWGGWRRSQIVLAAVKQNGDALLYASQVCKRDRDTVMAAATQDMGFAREHAADSCKSDRDIVWAAVGQSERTLLFAADGLIADPSFVPQAKQCHLLLRGS